MTSSSNTAVPMGGEPAKIQEVTASAVAHPHTTSTVVTREEEIATAKKIRAFAISIVTIDSVTLLCWLITWATPVLIWFVLIGIIGASVVSFVLPCLKKQALNAECQNMSKGTFIAHIVCLASWVVCIALVVSAASIISANGGYHTDSSAGLLLGGQILSIITLIALITALSFAGVLLCKLNSATSD